MMQIYASAARLRSSGAHSAPRCANHTIGDVRATATSDRRWQIVAYKRRFAKLEFSFLLSHVLLLLLLMSLTSTGSLPEPNLCLHNARAR